MSHEDRTRRSMLRWSLLAAASAVLAGCEELLHVPPGQIIRHTTPAATGKAPGQAKKKP
jgi:hypothetical protein